MKITSSNAVLGTEVKLVGGSYTDCDSNPLWNGKSGQIKGVINSIESGWVRVSWSNGTRNSYRDNELENFVETKNVTPISLETAVQTVTKSFIDKAKEFSAFDITKALRVEINEGRIVLDDRVKRDVNGIDTQFVTNDEVRGLVRNYVSTFSTYYRDFNQDFIVYKPNGSGISASVAPVAPAPASVRPVVTYSPSVKPQRSAVIFKSNGTITATKLLTYVDKKKNPTLKQIQSRFKVEGGKQVTVRQIESVVKAAGLRIDTKSPYYASVVTK